jgi:uncharacterized protein YkwD
MFHAMRSIVVVALVACGPKPAPQSQAVSCPPGAPQGSVCRPVECPPDSEPGLQCLDIQGPWERTASSTPSAPAPRAVPASSPRPPAEAPAAKAGSIAQRFVDAHNRVRAKHCAAGLAWSPKLAEVAQKWANHLRDAGCTFGHSGGTYGENLAAGTEGVLDPEATVAMWYDEIKLYKFPDGGFSMKTGHFTQVIWRGTKQVGCGHSQCNGNDIWVCNYDPPGNWEGQYRESVLPSGCR